MSSNASSKLLFFTAVGSAVCLGYSLLGSSLQQSSTQQPDAPASSSTPVRPKSPKKYDKTKKVVEICLSDVASLSEAGRGEATAVELCSNRQEGGVTPSLGLVEEAVKYFTATDVAVNVLIRPRPGNFVYSAQECEVIQRDVINAKLAGADGEII